MAICDFFKRGRERLSEKEAAKPVADGGNVADFFDDAFKYSLGNEGGYSDHPNDKGGPTNWGVIQSEYSKFLGRPASKEDVKNMPLSDAKAIYRANYWNPLRLSEIGDKETAMALFDRALLNGLTGVSRHVKNVLEAPQDEKPNFHQQIYQINYQFGDSQEFISKLATFCDKAHYERCAKDASQKVFLLGWLNRVNRMRRELAQVPEVYIPDWVYVASGRTPPKGRV